VKAGAFSYEELLTLARIRALYASSDLPEVPDRTSIERTVVEIRREWYAR
jgi:hypothetical protein